MKPYNAVAMVAGIVLIIAGIAMLFTSAGVAGMIPVFYGGALIYLGRQGGRTALVVFGHTCIVLGCLLITWGIYLLPYSQPTLTHIFGRPLFWGLFSVMGGICANFHGFCRCMRG